ncbi:MAG: hypothetical protein H7Y31_17025 [Chitinophagaceae bacterium]|nr:hypothetical protein [Chitinophagaceae bacterium]
MKLLFILLTSAAFINAQGQTTAKKPAKPAVRYDTIIVKHVTAPPKKPVTKAEPPPLPVPEFINQPYYFDKEGNRIIKLENGTAQLVTKKKSLGLKGARQYFTMPEGSSRVRFTARNNITFLIKTSGDVIDFTSYIKLYKFVPIDQTREVTITSKEGVLTDKEEGRGKLISFSIKMLTKDNYMIQFTEPLEAGEYGFVWVKNMELKEFNVFGFGIDWKNSD